MEGNNASEEEAYQRREENEIDVNKIDENEQPVRNKRKVMRFVVVVGFFCFFITQYL